MTSIPVKLSVDGNHGSDLASNRRLDELTTAERAALEQSLILVSSQLI
jgi:hypothetical protein